MAKYTLIITIHNKTIYNYINWHDSFMLLYNAIQFNSFIMFIHHYNVATLSYSLYYVHN